jgi:ABC-type molybdate transport system substrate-binding protein
MRTSFPSTKISAPTLWATLALLVPITFAACGGSNNNHPPDAPQPDAAVPDAPPDAAAPLTVLAAGASEGAITEEAGAFTTKTGLSYTFTIQSATALQTTITTGAMQPDVVVVTPAVITAINDFVLAGSNVNLGQIVSGLAVRSTDTAPAIDTAAAFTDALNQADVWYYSTGTAGKTFEKIVAAVGLTGQLTTKQKVLAGGKDAMLALAADSTSLHPIAVSQLSEIRSVPTVQYVGPYPSDLPSDLLTPTVYAAVILKSSTRVPDAQKLLQFFLSAEFQAQLEKSGFSPYTVP